MTDRGKIVMYSALGILSGIALFGLFYKRKDIAEGILNWIEPISGKLTSGFGNRIHPVTGKLSFHNGIDLAAPNGTPIKAPMSGVVKLWTDNKSGNALNIQHNDNLISGYAHLSKFNVKKGQSVKKGDVIGYVGSTGMSTGNHLHFVVKIKNKKGTWDYVNPLNYIKIA
jgi:murein DD-endopeptidase MepM/ murein hydrolase activator NlpD